MLPEVWVLDPIAPAALDRLSAAVRCVPPEEVRGRDWTGTADGLIVRTTKVTAAEIERAARLRIIGKHGVGMDNIDLAAAAKRGIRVDNTPKANAPSVAELAVGLALSLARRIPEQDRALRAGRPIAPAQHGGIELAGAAIGLVGFGNTGAATARRFHLGFGSQILAYDPHLPADAFPDWVEPVANLDVLLQRARLVSIHMPLSPETRGLIGARELTLLGSGGYVLNLSRGGIVDEAALAEALAAGVIAGAASDVFVEEPPPASHPLLGLPNFVATPHIGAATAEALERVGLEIADKVIQALSGPAHGEIRP